MRILLDEMITPRLGQLLVGHDVQHVVSVGWKGINNGRLLALADGAGFDAIVTKDTGIPFQQNISGMRLSIVIVSLADQTRTALLALAPAIMVLLLNLEPGGVYRVNR